MQADTFFISVLAPIACSRRGVLSFDSKGSMHATSFTIEDFEKPVEAPMDHTAGKLDHSGNVVQEEIRWFVHAAAIAGLVCVQQVLLGLPPTANSKITIKTTLYLSQDKTGNTAGFQVRKRVAQIPKFFLSTSRRYQPWSWTCVLACLL